MRLCCCITAFFSMLVAFFGFANAFSCCIVEFCFFALTLLFPVTCFLPFWPCCNTFLPPFIISFILGVVSPGPCFLFFLALLLHPFYLSAHLMFYVWTFFSRALCPFGASVWIHFLNFLVPLFGYIVCLSVMLC